MLDLLGVAVAAFGAGFLIGRRWVRGASGSAGSLLVPPKLSPEEYEKDRIFYIEMYKTSMQQYDKLVPWVAGGGLVVSVPLLREINTLGGSRVALAVGWLALLVAVACSVVGHYASSRIYSSERAALDNVNRPDATDDNMREAATLHRSAKRSGVLTDVMNKSALVAVVSGLILLGVFAVSLIR